MFSRAQTAAYPAAPVSQFSGVSQLVTIGSEMRVGEGNVIEYLPQKLSLSAVAKDECESVLPMRPYLKGLMPSRACWARPRRSADRAYSPRLRSSKSAVSQSQQQGWLPGSMVPPAQLFQVSKSANSSVGERTGWASLSPLIWVTS